MKAMVQYERAGERVGGCELPIHDHQITLRAQDVPAGLTQVTIRFDEFTGQAGEDGFFVVPSLSNTNTSALVAFREREDTESVFRNQIMPIFAVSHGGDGFLAVVSGMVFEYELVVGVKDGGYYLYPRFILNDGRLLEDVTIHLLPVADASYSALARRYRQYQLERGACRPLRERVKEQPVLAEAARGLEVRVRFGWKPPVNDVPEQPPETEPPLHVALTFDRCRDILDEFKRQGIKDAEFCLVGWNRAGHDGAFPDLFPVEKAFGGEAGLVRLIGHAKDLGYLIAAHTLPPFAFSLAERYDPDDLLLDKEGKPNVGGYTRGLSGGIPRYVCSKVSHEKLVTQDFKDMAHLGFRGIHYLDVMNIVRPLGCCNPLHPITSTETGEWRTKSLELARQSGGGSASEGAWDFCIGSLDYALYTYFLPLRNPKLPDICDCLIPFWHIAYHGIVLYNLSSSTVNQAIKSDPTLPLQNLEFGGRPLAYFYSKFRAEGSDWMGEEDLRCDTDEELCDNVAKLKQDYDNYAQVRDLQFEFLDEHHLLAPGVAYTRYSNGTVIVVNRSEAPFAWEGRTVPELSFLRLDL